MNNEKKNELLDHNFFVAGHVKRNQIILSCCCTATLSYVLQKRDTHQN